MRSVLQQSSRRETMNELLRVRQGEDQMKVADVLGVEKGRLAQIVNVVVECQVRDDHTPSLVTVDEKSSRWL